MIEHLLNEKVTPLPLKWQQAILTTEGLVIPSKYEMSESLIAALSKGLQSVQSIAIAEGELKKRLIKRKEEFNVNQLLSRTGHDTSTAASQ